MKVSMHLGKKLSIRHNLRQFTQGEWNKDGHINAAMSHKNEILINEDLREVFREEFSAAIEDFDRRQKNKDRRIGGWEKYYSEQKKKAQEMILQVGNEHEQLTPEQYHEFFGRAVEMFQKENPSLRVFHASVHYDETTPHLHLDFIPIATSERGLAKKISVDGALKNIGFARDKKSDTYGDNAYIRWLKDRRVRFENLASEYAEIVRSEPCVVAHQDPQQYNYRKKQGEMLQGCIDDLQNSKNPFAVTQAAHKLLENAAAVSELMERKGSETLRNAQKEREALKRGTDTLNRQISEYNASVKLLRASQERLQHDRDILSQQAEKLKKERSELDTAIFTAVNQQLDHSERLAEFLKPSREYQERVNRLDNNSPLADQKNEREKE